MAVMRYKLELHKMDVPECRLEISMIQLLTRIQTNVKSKMHSKCKILGIKRLFFNSIFKQLSFFSVFSKS